MLSFNDQTVEHPAHKHPLTKTFHRIGDIFWCCNVNCGRLLRVGNISYFCDKNENGCKFDLCSECILLTDIRNTNNEKIVIEKENMETDNLDIDDSNTDSTITITTKITTIIPIDIATLETTKKYNILYDEAVKIDKNGSAEEKEKFLQKHEQFMSDNKSWWIEYESKERLNNLLFQWTHMDNMPCNQEDYYGKEEMDP